MWRELMRDATRLVLSWWRVDRIRTSPDEGRLLRLEPPCFVVVAGRPAEVLSRIVGHDAEGAFVAYDCRGSRGTYRLRVSIEEGRSTPHVAWSADGVERSLRADDVEIFAPNRTQRLLRAESAPMYGSPEAGKIT